AQLGHSSPLDATVILLSPLSLPDALPIFGQFPANRSPVAAAPRAGSSLLRWSRRNQPSVDSHITSIGLRASTTWACRSGEPHHAPPSPGPAVGSPRPPGEGLPTASSCWPGDEPPGSRGRNAYLARTGCRGRSAPGRSGDPQEVVHRQLVETFVVHAAGGSGFDVEVVVGQQVRGRFAGSHRGGLQLRDPRCFQRF